MEAEAIINANSMAVKEEKPDLTVIIESSYIDPNLRIKQEPSVDYELILPAEESDEVPKKLSTSCVYKRQNISDDTFECKICPLKLKFKSKEMLFNHRRLHKVSNFSLVS